VEAVHPIATIPFRRWIRPKAAKIIDLLPTVPDPVDRSQLFPSVLFLQLFQIFIRHLLPKTASQQQQPLVPTQQQTLRQNQTKQ
jgi:hypothetical protein